MILQKLIIYGFVLNLAFAPLFANTPSSKGSLSQEDIEKIADRIAEKMQEKTQDPEWRQKMIDNFIAFHSHPEIEKFKQEQKLKELADPKMEESRKQKWQADVTEEIKNNIHKSSIVLGIGILIVVGSLTFAAGVAVGSKK